MVTHISIRHLIWSCIIGASLGYTASFEYDLNNGQFVGEQSPMPFGEKIVIFGKAEAELKKLEIELDINGKIDTVGASIVNGRWSTSVGPFAKSSNVIFNFKYEKSIKQSEIDSLIVRLNKDIQSYLAGFISAGTNNGVSPQSFTKEFQDQFTKVISDKYMDYMIDNKEKLGDFLNILSSKYLSDPVLRDGLLNDVSKIQEFKYLKEHVRGSGGIACNELKKNGADNKLFSDSTLSAEDVNPILERLVSVCERNAIAVEMFSKEMTDGLSRALSKKRNVSNQVTSNKILGIETYIGFDVGMMMVAERAITPAFISLSPYFIKTDPSFEYKIDLMQPSTLLHIITPTLGVGFGDEAKGFNPLYFVGGSIRMNKVVRISVGSTFFKKNEDFKFDLAIGASLNINYLSEFMNLLNASKPTNEM